MSVSRSAAILIHALVGWALCGAVMGIAQSAVPLEDALVIHAAAAPVIFAAVSLFYFKRPDSATPLRTACAFVAVVMLLDFFVVAMAVLHSFAMFASVVGTWLPFALIFLSTYATGLFAGRRRRT